jgi:hypothetical protein
MQHDGNQDDFLHIDKNENMPQLSKEKTKSDNGGNPWER